MFRFEQKFPQIRLTILVQPCPRDAEPHTYLFWLFNRSGIANPLERGGNNRHLLVWLEPETSQLSVISGYGLEPILGRERLENALTAASCSRQARSPVMVLFSAVREIDRVLTEIWTELPRIYGWVPEDTWWPLEDGSSHDPDATSAEVIDY